MLIKVTAITETMIQVDDDLTPITAYEKAEQIIQDDNFGCLQADLRVCNCDDVSLSFKPIISKEELPQQMKNYAAWEEDGGTTMKTCEEILNGNS